MFDKIQNLRNKKLLIKVLAGILILMVAFFFYLEKDKNPQSDIIITNGESDFSTTFSSMEAIESQQENPETITIVVDIGGAVMNPTVVSIGEGSRIYEAIEKAGGLTANADIRGINQAQILMDGEKIYIPTKQEVEDNDHLPSHGYNSPFQSQSNSTNLININTADSSTLQNLSGVGPSTAEKIIAYRNEIGKFKTLEELKNVSGIGEKTFEKLKTYITL
ncbi:MAG: helix-hairpin-helix domain-containing protein [Anaerovoracaceae bacterium]